MQEGAHYDPVAGVLLQQKLSGGGLGRMGRLSGRLAGSYQSLPVDSGLMTRDSCETRDIWKTGSNGYEDF